MEKIAALALFVVMAFTMPQIVTALVTLISAMQPVLAALGA